MSPVCLKICRCLAVLLSVLRRCFRTTRTQLSWLLLSSKLFTIFSAAATTSSVAPVSALGGPLFEVNPSLPPGAEKSRESNLDRVRVEIKPSVLACAVGKFVETGLGFT